MARTIIVDEKGSGDFKTVQEAVLAAPDYSEERTIIQIKKGVYFEKIVVPESKTNLSFIGDKRDNTALVYDDYSGLKDAEGNKPGIDKCASTFVHADGFYAENLTFSNQAGIYKGQAVALMVTGDRAVFRNVCIRGNQDTLYATGKGRQYYFDSFIEGTVDYIFGSATAVFDQCEIHSIRRHNGYVTAASTSEQQKYGYVFLNCRLTGTAPERTVTLGRPWRPYAKVIFLNTWMDRHIRPEGWDNWRDPEREKTAQYAEHGSTGPGAAPESRLGWSRQLTRKEAEHLTLAEILGGNDGWDPLSIPPYEG
jgi:pectinesterase